jgi:DNA-binding CsgD family transcriptional regulator
VSPRCVGVAHRERMLAEGLGAALDRFPQIAMVGTASNILGVEDLATRTDALAIDCELVSSAEIRCLRARGLRVVAIGDCDEDQMGVSVPTHCSVATLAAALVPGIQAQQTFGDLTDRERQVLGLVARGLAGKQVARQLGISPKTVEQHKSRIFSKLGVSNQTAAVSLALAQEAGSTQAFARSLREVTTS